MRKVLFTSHLANFVKFNKPYMKWFQEQGWEVHYASLDEEEIPFCSKHFKVQFNRSPYSPDNIKAYFQLKKIIDTEQYDLIHCHTPMGGVVTRLAAINARKRGTKVLYTAHGFHFYRGAPKLNWLLYYPMEKFLSCFTDCLITMNEEDYQVAIDGGFKAKRIEKIDGVGVDLTRFRPAVSKEERLALREQLGISRDAFVLIYVAEFIDRKNHAFLVQNLSRIKKEIPQLCVIFAGKGERLDDCERMAAELGVACIIHFLGYRRDVELLYRISDVLVSVSKQEGLPINIVEGMASGLPVVCTAIRGQTDVVVAGRNGYLCNLGDSYALCANITLLQADKELQLSIMRNNILDVQKYSQKRAVARMIRVYEQ